MTKPSARVVDDSTDAPPTARGSTDSVDDLHAGVVEPPDRRADLARQPGTHGPVGPRPGASAQGANRPAGEEIVGTETRHGIARQQEHQPMPDSPQAGWTAGTHGDPVNGQIAVPRENHRREVLDADARPARHDDHIGLGLERVQDRIVFVRHQTRENRRDLHHAPRVRRASGRWRRRFDDRAAANRTAAVRCRSRPGGLVAG